MDLTFVQQEGVLNIRACAVITDGNRLLVMEDGRAGYSYLPGGRVHLFETWDQAVLRECDEELGCRLRIDRPLWINQGFFEDRGRRFHELCVYYLMDISGSDLLNRGDTFTVHEEAQTNTFTWIPYDRLQETAVYPVFICKEIRNLPQSLMLRVENELS